MWLDMEMDTTGSGACGSWWWRSVAWREEGTFWGEKLLGEYGRCSVFNLVLNFILFFIFFKGMTCVVPRQMRMDMGGTLERRLELLLSIWCTINLFVEIFL
jgi:hypothetical protein